MGHIAGANSGNLDLKKRINELEAEVEELNSKKIYEFKGASSTNSPLNCQLEADHVYLAVVQSPYAVATVAIVEAGSMNVKINEIVESAYHKFSIDKDNLVLTVTSNGDNGYVCITEIA